MFSEPDTLSAGPPGPSRLWTWRGSGEGSANESPVRSCAAIGVKAPSELICVRERSAHCLRKVSDTEARAKTPEQPGVTVEFGVVGGTFPHQLQQSPVSLFHPEENGGGFVYWLARVDQAAKNLPVNPTAFHVTAMAGSSAEKSEIRTDAQIRYKVLAR